MPVLTQYTYIFVVGTLFSLLDAYCNGSNDVANSWATSVSSRSISYRQAMLAGAIFEFLGAVTVGARTADTIKNGIIPTSAFKNNAGVQMLAFMSALAASSMWVLWCTRRSTHVSSTYSLISAVAGVGVATAGASQVQWGWNSGKGLAAIFAGLGIAPSLAAAFGASIYMLIKTVVLMRKNPIPWAIYTSPFFFFLAATVCTLSIIFKGAPQLGLGTKPTYVIAAAVVGSASAVALFAAVFFVPYVYAKVVKKDYTLRWFHFFYGPLLWSRPAPPENAEASAVPNYAVVHDDEDSITRTSSEQDVEERKMPLDPESDVELADAQTQPKLTGVSEKEREQALKKKAHASALAKQLEKPGLLGWALRTLRDNPRPAGEAYEIPVITNFFGKRLIPTIISALLYGAHYDIHAAQAGIRGTPDGERMARVYSYARKYPNEIEHPYSFVQVLTACVASFAHGSNDVGNAVGPWSALYQAWSTGSAQSSKSPVAVWQLAVGGIMIGIGLATYGYKIMVVMGNKLTYHSPSRGCSMEMGAALTVLLAAQYGIPVSTSMCITGATIGVGLCNGNIRAVNWNRVGLLLLGWIMTIPVVGTLAGCIMGFLLNTPHFL